MNTSLSEHRKKASDLSLGSSHQVIYKKALQILAELPSSDQHLDFGSGQGQFLIQMQQEQPDCKLTGIDLMPAPEHLPSEIQWKSGDLNEPLPIEDQTFSSISALEIIEHLENPRHVLRELHRILKPSGWLLLSTPNNESLRAILSFFKRGHFVAFTDREYPAHITALNRLDLVRAAQESGFQVEKFAFTDRGCFPGWTRQTWQGLSFGVLKGLRFSDNLFIVLRK